MPRMALRLHRLCGYFGRYGRSCRTLDRLALFPTGRKRTGRHLRHPPKTGGAARPGTRQLAGRQPRARQHRRPRRALVFTGTGAAFGQTFLFQKYRNLRRSRSGGAYLDRPAGHAPRPRLRAASCLHRTFAPRKNGPHSLLFGSSKRRCAAPHHPRRHCLDAQHPRRRCGIQPRVYFLFTH